MDSIYLTINNCNGNLYLQQNDNCTTITYLKQLVVIMIITIISHGLNARGCPMPASQFSASCFGPLLSGLHLADITP